MFIFAFLQLARCRFRAFLSCSGGQAVVQSKGFDGIGKAYEPCLSFACLQRVRCSLFDHFLFSHHRTSRGETHIRSGAVVVWCGDVTVKVKVPCGQGRGHIPIIIALPSLAPPGCNSIFWGALIE